jgi:hypothetical protein
MIVIFILSLYIALLIEHKFEKLIRFIYEYSTDHNISFHHPKLYLNFKIANFCFSFAIFNLLWIFITSNLNILYKILNYILFVFVFFISSYIISSISATIDLTTCTACIDGTLKLYYNSVHYDFIFFSSLVISLFFCYILIIYQKKFI